MLTRQDFIATPPTVQVRLALEPVLNILNSVIVLTIVNERSGLPAWVYETENAFTDDEKHLNVLVNYFFPSLYNLQHFDDFDSYLAWLDGMDPAAFRATYFEHYRIDHPDRPLPAEFETDRAAFLSYVRALHEDKGSSDERFDEAMAGEVFDRLTDPAALKALLVSHLRSLWEKHLKAEWQRVLPMIQDSIAGFEQVDLTDLTALEAIRAVTGRDLTNVWDTSDEITQYVFVPSAHLGPYIVHFRDLTTHTTYIMFGARLPEGTRNTSNALSRSELLVQLSALADETRLTILELLTQYRELCAQDIITRLNLSQSSASRHLRQLTASGYLIERRRDVNKCYSLNRSRIQDTALALNVFFGSR
jgi:DNA-binding transcriptional ArsR family regulator